MIRTADDFGRDAERNEAIVRAFDRGLVTHTSLMANMPGFEEACELARDRGLLDRVGIHLVLTAGAPLTDGMRSVTRFCDESGAFRRWRHTEGAFAIRPAEARAVRAEWTAQIERTRRAGAAVSHADSHHHVHNELALLRVVIALAREHEIERVRLVANCGTGVPPLRRLYHGGMNAALRARGLAGTRWFGNVDDIVQLAAERGVESLARAELMLHPRIDGTGRLVDEEWPDVSFEELLERLPAA